MGSSGSKKTRKGKPRQHLAKVGTPAENAHTQHAAERDVVGNFGVRGKGWMFWGAVIYLVGRVAYLPLYLWGVFGIRTLVWNVATIGLVVMLLAVLF